LVDSAYYTPSPEGDKAVASDQESAARDASSVTVIPVSREAGWRIGKTPGMSAAALALLEQIAQKVL
jgi:hypothetical protein